MTDAISYNTQHQLIRHTATYIEAGEVTQSWCSIHKDRTDHLWTGHKLICLECHPELRPSDMVLT